ncbi:unnamed protein product [Allacma fusca]|uniref:Phospholipid scramblase n=1 Tax=Allacma fusca TaxID=39272 RepID=A0A8J2PAM7_9HEXA|nr:unnamed protein product [Allacma fusca]
MSTTKNVGQAPVHHPTAPHIPNQQLVLQQQFNPQHQYQPAAPAITQAITSQPEIPRPQPQLNHSNYGNQHRQQPQRNLMSTDQHNLSIRIPVPPLQALIPGVPMGLEPLVGIGSMSCRQQLEMLEVMFQVETNNRYDVYNNYGYRIFSAGEVSSWAKRCFMGKHRPFEILIENGFGQTVMKVERECNCQLCFFGGRIAGSNIIVQSAFTGEVYGRIIQRCSCCCPVYDIVNGKAENVMVLRGPRCGTCCPLMMCCDAKFDVFRITPGGEEMLGAIMKRFDVQELFSDANNFGMAFPINLDPQLKAVLLGAIFCVDFSFFESDASNNCSFSPGYMWIFTFMFIIVFIILFMLAKQK